ncbi:MAG: alpha/beta hydrolase [Actinomycetota bacterium]|nr:alpha/beta hydrolase [Actinomycetota bacterium]
MVRRLVRGLLGVLLLPAAWVPAPPVEAGDAVSVQRVSFPVTFDARDKGDKVWGFLYRPAAAPCTSSVLLLLHDVSYASHQWDLPVQPERYSTARALAAAGYPTVAVDLPGHASSDGGDGTRLHVALYADVTAQLVDQLRTGNYRTFDGQAPPRFGRVGLVGAGIGTEIAELAAARDPELAVLVATGYSHFPSRQFLADYAHWEVPQTIGKPYTYFGGLPHRRVKYMYDIRAADVAVVNKDTALSQFAPSGLVLTMMSQPSRAVAGSIGIPLLLLLGEQDYMFPSAHAQDELALFTSAGDKTMTVVAGAGHSLFLHRNAPETHQALVDWLRQRPEALPAC